MPIDLSKGQRLEVTPTKISVGLGWKPSATPAGEPDLDASVFMLDAARKLPEDHFFIFYNNLNSPDRSVEHSGDVLVGTEKTRDQETITVNFPKVDERVQEMVFVVNIDEADRKKQTFGDVRDAYIRITDAETGKELARYQLSEDFSEESAIEIGRFYRKGDGWKFEAMGYGYSGGLLYFLKKYH